MAAAHRALCLDPPVPNDAADGEESSRTSSSSSESQDSYRTRATYPSPGPPPPSPLLVLVMRRPEETEAAARLLVGNFGLWCRVVTVGPGGGEVAGAQPPQPPQAAPRESGPRDLEQRASSGSAAERASSAGVLLDRSCGGATTSGRESSLGAATPRSQCSRNNPLSGPFAPDSADVLLVDALGVLPDVYSWVRDRGSQCCSPLCCGSGEKTCPMTKR